MWTHIVRCESFTMRSRLIQLLFVALFLLNLCLTFFLLSAQQGLRNGNTGADSQQPRSGSRKIETIFNHYVNMSLLMRANAMQRRQLKPPQKDSTRPATTTHSNKTRLSFITCTAGGKPHNFQRIVMLAGNISKSAGTKTQLDTFRLTIGISSIARPDGTFYLYDTLQSLFDALTPADAEIVNVVLMLAHDAGAERDAVQRQLVHGFRKHINSGILHIIRKPEKADFYDADGNSDYNAALGKSCYNCLFPPVEKVLSVDADERMQPSVSLINGKQDANVDAHIAKQWKAQQSLDYAFLWDYAHTYLAHNPYYLQLEDDVTTAREFVRHIRTSIAAVETGGKQTSAANNQTPTISSGSLQKITSHQQRVRREAVAFLRNDKNKLVISSRQEQQQPLSNTVVGTSETGNEHVKHVHDDDATKSIHFLSSSKTHGGKGLNNDELTKIKKRLVTTLETQQQQKTSTPKHKWALIEFAVLGFIGKLFHTEQLPKLAGLARVFYNDIPVDWLLLPWRHLMDQPNFIAHLGSSLFQHRGVVSSLPGRVQLLREKVFVGGDASSSMRYGGDNPPALLNTDVIGYESSPLLQSVYAPLLGARSPFWFKTPRKGNWISIRFLQPVRLEKIIIDTGELNNKKRLSNALVNDIAIVTSAEPGLLGKEQLQANEIIKVCTFNAAGVCYADDLHTSYSFRVSQLRIRFESDYTHDAVINEIGVFTYKEGKLLEDPVEIMLGKRKAYEKMVAEVVAKNMDFMF